MRGKYLSDDWKAVLDEYLRKDSSEANDVFLQFRHAFCVTASSCTGQRCRENEQLTD